ncbi:hypothetical protein B0H13DRAFT_2358580 [Mycena leptocephala]|nr:hypothetical protein B0H13DRAFT_2358580 [Mycena leptocephala]
MENVHGCAGVELEDNLRAVSQVGCDIAKRLIVNSNPPVHRPRPPLRRLQSHRVPISAYVPLAQQHHPPFASSAPSSTSAQFLSAFIYVAPASSIADFLLIHPRSCILAHSLVTCRRALFRRARRQTAPCTCLFVFSALFALARRPLFGAHSPPLPLRLRWGAFAVEEAQVVPSSSCARGSAARRVHICEAAAAATSPRSRISLTKTEKRADGDGNADGEEVQVRSRRGRTLSLCQPICSLLFSPSPPPRESADASVNVAWYGKRRLQVAAVCIRTRALAEMEKRDCGCGCGCGASPSPQRRSRNPVLPVRRWRSMHMCYAWDADVAGVHTCAYGAHHALALVIERSRQDVLAYPPRRHRLLPARIRWAHAPRIWVYFCVWMRTRAPLQVEGARMRCGALAIFLSKLGQIPISARFDVCQAYPHTHGHRARRDK